MIVSKTLMLEILPNIMLILTGISTQLAFLFKIIIIGYPEISGNQITASLDLLRRVIINVCAYYLLNEYYNMQIIGANICMFVSFIFIILSQYNKPKSLIYNELPYDSIEISQSETEFE